MSQFRLICNFNQCRKTLLQSAYVTTCSHVFCNEHGLNITAIQELVCPVCNTHFASPQDIIRVNLNPDEVTKSVMMAGLSPELIMDVSTRALAFWGYQLNEENAYLEAGLKAANENIAVLGAYCEHNHAKYKSEINTLQRKIDSLNEDLDINKKRCQDLIQQIQEKTKIINKLQLKIMTKNSSSNISIKEEDDASIFRTKLTPIEKPVFKTAPFNTFRFPKQEQTPNFRFIPGNNNSIFTPGSFHQQKSSIPNYFTLFPKKEEKREEINTPCPSNHGQDLDCKQEFHFAPNLNFN